MAAKQLSIKFTDPLTGGYIFIISSLNRNSEGAVNLKVLMFTQSSISLEALYVNVIASLPKSFSLVSIISSCCS